MEIIESSRTSPLVYELFLTGLQQKNSDLTAIVENCSEDDYFVNLYRYDSSGEYMIWCGKAQLSDNPLQSFWIIFPESELDAATEFHKKMIELFERYYNSVVPDEFRDHLENAFDKLLKDLQDI